MQYMKLSDEFLSQYKGKQPKWGFDGLGYIIYLRTYARTKQDGTLEDWWETVRRFTEGNFNIEAQRLVKLGKFTFSKKRQLRQEMERFYHMAFNLVILPPGRGMWMSGTEYANRVGDAENNCWFISMRPQAYGKVNPLGVKSNKPLPSFPAVFTFDQAMKGGGVGDNIQIKNTGLMPEVKNSTELKFYVNAHHEDVEELLALKCGVHKKTLDLTGKQVRDLESSFVVPDSREGWANALRIVIDAHFEGKDSLAIDVSKVRPKGAPIRGFGGTASGPAPLVEMLTKVNRILNRRVGRKLTPTEWGDIIQLIGTCVVAGNVRRTALILIGDQDDQQFIQSKNYELEENQAASQWRWASNNSVDISFNTTSIQFKKIAENIYYNGEPGVVNVALAKDYGRIADGKQEGVDEEVEGFNPCGEVTLPNGSPCNLFEINLPRIHELIEAGVETDFLYEEAAYMAARYAYRVTFRPYEWEVTREIVERHRRLGIGITGITDWVLMKFGDRAILGFNDNGDPIFNKEVTKSLDALYNHVKESNIAQAKDLGANESIKLTTVKPSGTVSILMGVSPGQHFHWSKYMVRRVRFAANAPLVPVLEECGYPKEQAIKGFDEKGNPVYDENTVVFSFPVKAPIAEHEKFQSAGDVPLHEQAAIQALLQTFWSDNAVSATLSFKKALPKPVYFSDGTQLQDKFGYPVLEPNPREEKQIVEEIADVLNRYSTVLKSTSLLPHATETYPQMPYEEISEEEYKEMASKITAKPWEVMNGTILADQESEEDVIGECEGGVCPIK
ncbi:ribonucleoside-triphosphate reductase, adenosylcobalamin-dependent [Pueribacillus theae]|uniref:Adenosylcobalamin-dependent ribonucleoside-triphosphate reductase n=1 Tax=Pueribacillus theae TaxID=2171751 RepID=A0A2U1K0Q3_9BACI|nr:ribonucleoside-triphosphate reductase, adenosylcobalamin-dependent [Pueribacillus theae]PWA11090.1 ribonucleoside-triphosphate reductase, adenosylcobalamin-dependent [Pueribacillus theae]